MESALAWHRFHFAFTITYHCIFPQLTMGLALLVLVLKTMALRTRHEHYNQAARFWARTFAISFAVGVVTGIPSTQKGWWSLTGTAVRLLNLRLGVFFTQRKAHT